MDLLSRLSELVGEDNLSVDSGDLTHYGLDWTRFYTPAPIAVVFPRTTEKVAEIVRFARTEKLGLVPSGGRTGMSGGACALNGELVVSFDKMNQVKSYSEADANVVVEAGVVTAQVHEYAAARGLCYPVDFASSGSSQIGGNIATNAGGIRVIRYGMTRSWVSGLTVVTGTGEVMSLNQGLMKNNTGYDLRHTFIGSEGTLGFITEATLQLIPAPGPATVCLLAVNAMQDCLNLLSTFRQAVTLNAFEFFSDNALSHVLSETGFEPPFAERSPYYVLLELEENAESMDAVLAAYEQSVAAGWVRDGVISQSESQNRDLWQYRERITESITPKTPYKNDIAVKISQVPEFLTATENLVRAKYPNFEVLWFGHIGDGNLHLNILKPDDWDIDQFRAECETVSHQILTLVKNYGGSVSAEHGIGLLKKSQLGFTRTESEIAAMKAIKQIFDPDGIMNPGKVFD